MNVDLNKFWILVVVVLVLGIPVGAVQVNDGLTVSNQVSNAKTYNMNIELHANNNYSSKFNATGAKIYNIVKKPVHGNLTCNKTSGKFVYSPNKNFIGTDTFTYNVNNGKTNSNTATVTINVVNSAPIVQDMNFTVLHGKTYIGILNASDNDGDNLTYRILSKPEHGTLNLNPDGTYNYTANGTYKGPDIFNYVVNDGIRDSNTGSVRITVTNTRPIATNITVSPSQDEKMSGSDADGDILTYIITSKPKKGTLIYDNVSNTYNYMPKYDFDGSDSFTYIVNDGYENSENAIVKIYM
jgi:large repetitive protein